MRNILLMGLNGNLMGCFIENRMDNFADTYLTHANVALAPATPGVYCLPTCLSTG